jgi:dTDP-4-amino-4,6-dideoxygalactose transaminase
MAVPLLDLRAQYATIKADVVRALMGVVDAQTFILGEPVGQLECAVAGLSHTKFAVGCASGTDALLLALRALDIGRGDEVITAPFTFFATAGTIHNVGATPVFVDIDPLTFDLDPRQVTAALTPRTRAIIPVDLFGQMAPIDRIAAAAPGLPLIEDAAQSIGARRSIDGEWRMAGEAATIGTLSFFPSKNLGGYGDGGMMVTQDEHLYKRLLRLRTHGGVKTYYHEEVGYNSRLDALQAAVLQAKLPHLAGWSARRRAHAARYTAAFAKLAPHVRSPIIAPENESIFNQYTIRAERRDALQAHLTARGIGSSIYFRSRSICSPALPTWGIAPVSCPNQSEPARKFYPSPCFLN